ncbi:allantoinase AllB [Alloacidobacterium dinghuense]|uniref:allantoinase n=1 Tax=Alloacidobacterium dinghuense TaxID=2763107 RepID=A0A7G8BJZ4_9BACT|nr:allantoinase AllB [Alloacidobacterium dinghuense]QNI32864.1 allantoinase AllB [Alloacidobacterium dinghuense]
MTKVFISQHVLTPVGIRPAAVIVDGEKIVGLRELHEIPPNVETVDCGRYALLPGLVDAHTHINEPGRTDWEGFETGTMAAAAGGFTTLIDMPLNCLPATTTVAALEAKRNAASGKCMVDWCAWGGISEHNTEHLELLAANGVRGFKCFLADPGIDGFARVDEAELRTAAKHIVRTGLPLLTHAELPGPIQLAGVTLTQADWRKYGTWLASRPDEAEIEAIRLMLGLSEEYGFRLHIVHLATAYAIPDLCRARERGVRVTIETCPHYLHFAAETIPDGSTLHKCAPPIRSAANREALWEALKEGVIDLIGTDHSPCPPTLKRLNDGNFQTAWGGIASLSVALPAVWSGMRIRGFNLGDLARWMSANPAALASIDHHKGAIAEGRDADLVVFDPDREIGVVAEGLHTRHLVSPYLGERMYGKVLATWLRGEQVFVDGKFPSSCRGREVR